MGTVVPAFRRTKSERARLYPNEKRRRRRYKTSDGIRMQIEPYSVLDVLDTFDTTIWGCADQVLGRGFLYHPSASEARAQLLRSSFLQTGGCSEWLLTSAKEYPKLTKLCHLLEYLRLLVLECDRLHRGRDRRGASRSSKA